MEYNELCTPYVLERGFKELTPADYPVYLLGDEINVNYLEDLIVKVEKKITRKVSFKIVKVLPKGSLVIYNNDKI